MIVRAGAHAKLNLALAVTGRRDDGFHELRSVFARIAVHDDLEAGLDPGGHDDHLAVSGIALPVEGNLVLAAPSALRDELGADLPALGFRLRKHIPIGAGLGGGSSDAAAALGLALVAWERDLEPGSRRAVATRLGADVPFFDSGADLAIVTGIGERIEPLPPPRPPLAIVLVTPAEGLSTAAVFAAYDAGHEPAAHERADVDRIATAARAGRDALLDVLAEPTPTNDLWRAARMCAPVLRRIAGILAASTTTPFRLTGSGSTLFAVLPGPEDAETLATHVRFVLSGLDVRATVRTTTTTHPNDGEAT